MAFRCQRGYAEEVGLYDFLILHHGLVAIHHGKDNGLLLRVFNVNVKEPDMVQDPVADRFELILLPLKMLAYQARRLFEKVDILIFFVFLLSAFVGGRYLLQFLVGFFPDGIFYREVVFIAEHLQDDVQAGGPLLAIDDNDPLFLFNHGNALKVKIFLLWANDAVQALQEMLDRIQAVFRVLLPPDIPALIVRDMKGFPLLEILAERNDGFGFFSHMGPVCRFNAVIQI